MVFRFRHRYPIHQLREEMDQLLSGVLGRSIESPWLRCGRGQPAVNVWEDDRAVMVELEVPGVTADQVDISVVNDELSLKINRPDESQEDVTYHRRERPVGSFARVLRLPTDVDSGKVQADLRDGVLRITLPKAEITQPRKIQVKSV